MADESRSSYKSLQKENANVPVGILIGDVGGGKTHLYNLLCNENRESGNHKDSQTTKFAKAHTSYRDISLCLYDGPGSNAHKDVWKHSMVLKAGLTNEPLNAIFIVVPYQPRINLNIIDNLIRNMEILKEEHHNMVIPIITKMDHFQPDDEIKTVKQEKKRVKESILEEFQGTISDVLFYAKGNNIISMFQNMHRMMNSMPKRAIKYTKAEVAIHFNLKEWTVRDKSKLRHMQNKIRAINTGYIKGLQDYQKNNKGNMQEIVFSAIQQNYAELEDIYSEYCAKCCDRMVNMDDYSASIQLRKMVIAGQEDFRKVAKTFLSWDPDNASDWRNCVRKCNYCGEVWVKVEGCDGKTTCGNIPSQGDIMKKGQEFFKYVWRKGVNGIMQVFQTQETLSPEVSVCFDMLLIGVNDVSSMFVQIKEAIAKALKTEKGKVNVEKISSSQNMCKIRVGVHTRNVKEIQKIMNQRSGFVQDFKKSVDHEGLQLTEECIGDLKVNNNVMSAVGSQDLQLLQAMGSFRFLFGGKPNAPENKQKRKTAGCGRDIIWKNLEVLSAAEIENFLTVAEIESIVENISSKEAFKIEYQQKEKSLTEEDKFDEFKDTTIESDDENTTLDWRNILVEYGLGQYVGTLASEGLDDVQLWPDVSLDMLKDIGMKAGHRIKWNKMVKKIMHDIKS